ncbi:hypothetical protein A8709_15300 [Paenibacillus pectinilyticus]|uniref:Alpha-galactosidase n=1 Tax=Paenibacillus pectinilyticus TaxID=512399 RepID=A0A1C1A4E9_9BACL|nr:hypothetical protein [Paenibacillus pectinilyticus]OCT15442.1 hypothetical protein A8709_15300 [Paenibacillus pectinilyticus]
MSRTPVVEEKPRVAYEANRGQLTLTNGRLQLLIDLKDGLNPHQLKDIRSGRVYADGTYHWSTDEQPVVCGQPILTTDVNGTCTVVIPSRLGELHIEQTLCLPGEEPGVLTEVIRLINKTDHVLDTSTFACGFVKQIHDGERWQADGEQERFCDVPYRRHPETGDLCDYTMAEIATKDNWFTTVRSPDYHIQPTSLWGAEGWAWYHAGNTLLISKYNQDALEWSLLAPMERMEPDGMAKALRFGGAGRWKLGDPEGAAELMPGTSFAFGETRYQILDGEWKEAYAAFRTNTERKGHMTPSSFDPPVHWNELYDNLLWWTADTADNRVKYFQKADMVLEAEKAKEFGCGCLYLDPGWDTALSSNIWAEDRLGSQESFVQWLEENYQMKLGLHIPLAPWGDADAYPKEASRMDRSGNRMSHPDNDILHIDVLCSASSVYIETKIARLKELCRLGAYFLLFDGAWFAGECWDPSHGHSLPLTHQEHLDAILHITQSVHVAYPDVIIEQHDPMTGPGTPRYTPTYFMHGKPGGFDELWGNEYMIEPLDDIYSGRAISLYYANLAYSIPIYLHIDLRNDNEHALMFWWYASTCRHLGVGGTPTNGKIWEKQKKEMQVYLSLKSFYAQGIFYGLDETVHAHTLRDRGETVINFFNLETKLVQRQLQFRLADVGLQGEVVSIEGAAYKVTKDKISFNVVIPAGAHTLVRLKVNTGNE